jgi:hypothetical protein
VRPPVARCRRQTVSAVGAATPGFGVTVARPAVKSSSPVPAPVLAPLRPGHVLPQTELTSDHPLHLRIALRSAPVNRPDGDAMSAGTDQISSMPQSAVGRSHSRNDGAPLFDDR